LKRVPGIGPRDAKVVIVGEAPGRSEDMSGQPFTGYSGTLLDQSLAAVGLRRQDCYITNVVKTRPPNNDFGTLYRDSKRQEPSDVLIHSIKELRAEISQVQPNVIIALGTESLRALTGKQPITKWRGTVISTSIGKVIPTYHPAYILRMYHERVVFEKDLRRAVKESKSRDYHKPEPLCVVKPDFVTVMETLGRIQPGSRVSFDIETHGKHVRCLGLAWGRWSSICIPFTHQKNVNIGNVVLIDHSVGSSDPLNYWTEEQEYVILQELDRIFRDRRIQKIAQNAPFDTTILLQDFGLVVEGIWMDTLLAQHTCYAELPKSLDFLTSIYTDLGYYADYNASVDHETWVYNCYDVIATFQAAEALETELKELELWDFYTQHALPTMIGLTRVQNRGFPIDVKLRDKTRLDAEKHLRVVEETLRSKLAYSLNPRSPKQVADFLYREKKVPVIKGKSGSPSTDESALETIALKRPDLKPVIDLILDYRRTSKLISGFLSSELSDDNRMHTSFSAWGTVTGRISSSADIFGRGGNLQNIHRGPVRRIFWGEHGLISKNDLSQAEFRIVAWLANIRRLIDRFLNDPEFDVHSWNASENIFNVPLGEVTKDQRSLAKNGVYGGNYGMKAQRASKVYKLPYETAKFVLEKYLSAVHEIPQWWQSVKECINATRLLENPFGRKRYFLGRLDDDTYRKGYSHSAQSIVGDIINRAIYVLERLLPEGVFLVCQVHDEVVVWMTKDFLDNDTDGTQTRRVMTIIKNVMEFPIKFPDVPEPLVIPCELGLGPNWYDQVEPETWLRQNRGELTSVTEEE
jgi:uracil-DNA glycosylase family 4